MALASQETYSAIVPGGGGGGGGRRSPPPPLPPPTPPKKKKKEEIMKNHDTIKFALAFCQALAFALVIGFFGIAIPIACENKTSIPSNVSDSEIVLSPQQLFKSGKRNPRDPTHHQPYNSARKFTQYTRNS